MSLHTLESKTTANFLGRLTEVERCQIRGASEAGLESMVHTHFASDMITADQLKEAAKILHERFAEFTQRANWWDGRNSNQHGQNQ
jgi:hypothetical protein